VRRAALLLASRTEAFVAALEPAHARMPEVRLEAGEDGRARFPARW
jgi:hypothetical protein